MELPALTKRSANGGLFYYYSYCFCVALRLQRDTRPLHIPLPGALSAIPGPNPVASLSSRHCRDGFDGHVFCMEKSWRIYILPKVSSERKYFLHFWRVLMCKSQWLGGGVGAPHNGDQPPALQLQHPLQPPDHPPPNPPQAQLPTPSSPVSAWLFPLRISRSLSPFTSLSLLSEFGIRKLHWSCDLQNEEFAWRRG